MGCTYCTSGLGKACQGPNGLDDLEAACTCECHAENLIEFEDEESLFPEDEDWLDWELEIDGDFSGEKKSE